MDFRNELFALCKTLQKTETAQSIAELIFNLSVSSASNNAGEMIKNSHGDFAQIAKHFNNGFHGYLFLDENIESIIRPNILRVEHLTADERFLLEKGHKTLSRFVGLCLSDIAEKSAVLAESMNPYSYYKSIKVSEEAASFISDEDFRAAVSAFKNGKIYKALVSSDITAFINTIKQTNMFILIKAIEKETDQCLGEDVSKEIKDFTQRMNMKAYTVNDALFAFSLLIFALKDSLKIACQMLYRAICGTPLFVLNNDNIISIEKSVDSIVCQYYKIHSQAMPCGLSGNDMGSILLMDCDPQYGPHIHEFGMLVAQTINLAGEFGQSAKYSFVTVDEEMIYIHHLTNEILRIGLPIVKKMP